MEKPDIDLVKSYLLYLQTTILNKMLVDDPSLNFQEDNWQRSQGGGGRTCALQQGKIYEKAGINFSHVWGDQLPESATIRRPELKGSLFQAVGLSLIIHPHNPFVPSCHANLRFFIANNEQSQHIWWFGGGFDLTPYYGFEEDCIHWHKIAKKVCDPFGSDVYLNYKDWADRYFYIKHRQESRGIGGLFFDDLNQWDFDTCFAFIRSIGTHFPEAFFPIVDRRKDLPFNQKHRDFQCYRRGRYVEFNLVYDRGTLFGIQSGGRIESILISLPPKASWQYNWTPAEGSPEAELYEKYLQPKDWLGLK